MPTDLNGDLERMLTEGKYCIKAENALLVNDLLFYDFFWNESRHYTLWNTNSGELLTHSEKGYAMPYNDCKYSRFPYPEQQGIYIAFY